MIFILHLLILVGIGLANAQYFGKNKPGYKVFNYQVYQTPNFEIYHYFNDETLLNILADKSEEWYSIHSSFFKDTFRINNPLILYKNHSDFQQTTVSGSIIETGTGGFTEGLKNRVVMPVSQTKGQTDHVMGHELVHAFQYNYLLNSDSISIQQMEHIPLWMIEGMAEYLSIGSYDANTSMWVRDAILHDYFPTLDDISRKPTYNPYRYGQAFWAFASKTWGDTLFTSLLSKTARFGYKAAVDSVFGISTDSLSVLWKSSTEDYFKDLVHDTSENVIGKKIINQINGGDYNISPVISPNGRYIAFMSEKELFSIDIFIYDTKTQKISNKIAGKVTNSEVDAFNFLESSGTWSPDSKYFAYIVFAKGKNKLVIIDPKKGKIIKEHEIIGVESFTTPAWSPDGMSVVVCGLVKGSSNIYEFNLNTGGVKQLTSGNNSIIQPAFSPDGKQLVFSNQIETKENIMGSGRFNFVIQVLNLENLWIEDVHLFKGANHYNPVFSPDAGSIYFISDRNGIRNLYKYNIKDENTFMLTSYITGISGITPLSPAMSISNENHLVYSYYSKRCYSVYSANTNNFRETIVNFQDVDFRAACLPPYNINNSKVDSVLSSKQESKKTEKRVYKPINYKRRFQLDYISNTGVGVATSRIGTGVAGGVNALFSDMVGDNYMFANVSINGEISDFGGMVAYLNQKKRVNWGLSLSHIPYYYGIDPPSVNDTISVKGEKTAVYNDYIELTRMFESKASLFAYLPVSKSQRFETGLSAGMYNYRVDRFNKYYSEDEYLGETKERQPAPDGFKLIEMDFAYVLDNSDFGLTSPLRGHRARLQVLKNFGYFDYYSTLIDFRKYFYLNPTSLAFRLYNYNRIGNDADKKRISTMFLGYPWYIRGYGSSLYNGKAATDSLSLTLNQLIGSKMIVGNFEYRIPFTGPKRLSLIKSKYFISDLAFFADAGIAWDNNSSPQFKFSITKPGERIPLISTGISLRINIFGYMILEPFYAVPWQNGGWKNSSIGLNFLPGW